jgi:PAS domain S-box-containing protein
VDVTDQVKAQDDLKRERERLRLALEAGALAVWDFDPATERLEIDTRYAETMGFDPALKVITLEQIGARLHPEDRLRVAREHEALIATSSKYRIEFRIVTPKGDVRWLISQAIMIPCGLPSSTGRMVGILQDITERKRREQELHDLASARELLVREADHRIKNSLQMVISLLTVQLRGIDDKDAADALREAITRVSAIAACHLALQGSEDLRQVDFAITLKELCGHFAQLNPKIAIICRPREALMLDADRAIPLGLAVSEVVTNALRHAFPGRETGHVMVEALTESSGMIVRVGDDGVGMPQQSGSGGLGSRIIRALAAQVSAAVQVESTPQAGTAVTLRMPLTQSCG